MLSAILPDYMFHGSSKIAFFFTSKIVWKFLFSSGIFIYVSISVCGSVRNLERGVKKERETIMEFIKQTRTMEPNKFVHSFWKNRTFFYREQLKLSWLAVLTSFPLSSKLEFRIKKKGLSSPSPSYPFKGLFFCLSCNTWPCVLFAPINRILIHIY